ENISPVNYTSRLNGNLCKSPNRSRDLQRLATIFTRTYQYNARSILVRGALKRFGELRHQPIEQIGQAQYRDERSRSPQRVIVAVEVNFAALEVNGQILIDRPAKSLVLWIHIQPDDHVDIQ